MLAKAFPDTRHAMSSRFLTKKDARDQVDLVDINYLHYVEY